MSSVQDIGTGTKTILAQVSEELGTDGRGYYCKIGDTLYPDGRAPAVITAGSITPAVRNATYKAKMELLGKWLAPGMLNLDLK